MGPYYCAIATIFLWLHFIPSSFGVDRSSPSIQIFVDSSYPADFIDVVHWKEYGLRSDLEKIFPEGNTIRIDLLPPVSQVIFLSYYVSVEMDKKKFVRIFLSPCDKVEMQIYKNNEGQFNVGFKGSNADGHEHLTDFTKVVPRVHLQGFSAIPFVDEDDYTDRLIEFIESFTFQFKDLLKSKRIDSLYYFAVTNYIHSIFCRHIVSGFFRDREAIGRGIEYSDRIQIADQIIGHFNYGYPNIRGPNSYEFAYNRINLLRYLYLREKGLKNYSEMKGFQKIWREKTYEIAAKYLPIFEEEDEFLRKYLMAVTLHFEFNSLLGPEFEGDRGELYSYFKANYPNSRYLKDLEIARQGNYEKYWERIGKSPIRRDENYQFFEEWRPHIIQDELKIKGLRPEIKFDLNEDLHPESDLRDGIYYVTVWASWCAPCIRNFSHNFHTDSLLHSYGAKRLYISIDNPLTRYDAWSEIIKEYKLGGYHVLAGQELKFTLMENFGTGGTIFIPRYFLIKEGEVAFDPAPEPGNLVELRKMLRKIKEEKE